MKPKVFGVQSVGYVVIIDTPPTCIQRYMCTEEIVMHTAAAEWEWSIIRGERKKEMKTEREREREREREVGYELELWAVGSRSVQLSQSWLTMEAVKIHLLPAHYNFILEPGALERRSSLQKQWKTPTPLVRGAVVSVLQERSDNKSWVY